MLEFMLGTLIGLVTIQLAEKTERTDGPQMDLSDLIIKIFELRALTHM